MADKVQDRRIHKTLQLLQNALAELISEKGYDEVTIQEILDRANVGRSTFYAHFENKDQLLRSILTLLNERFEEGIKNVTEGHKNYEDNSANMPFRVLEFVEQNHRLFRAMLGKQRQGSFTNPLYDYLFTVTREHFRMMLQLKLGDTAQIEMVAHFYTSAFIGALTWWLDHNIIYSAEELSQQINRLMLPGLKTILDD